MVLENSCVKQKCQNIISSFQNPEKVLVKSKKTHKLYHFS